MDPKKLFLLQVMLQLADLGTTKMVLDAGGAEMNPLMAPIADNILAFGAIKALPLAMIGRELKNDSIDKKKASKILKGLNLFTSGLVLNNLYQISKARR